jgi:hypothetical protein
MLYAMLAACATLIFVLVLAVPRAAEARRLARLFRAQQKRGRDDGPRPKDLSFRRTLTHDRSTRFI